jgi:hypothetical protein
VDTVAPDACCTAYKLLKSGGGLNATIKLPAKPASELRSGQAGSANAAN